MLDDLEKHLREDVKDVPEPRAQALFETTAEVVTGLKTAYDHYERGSEEAWRRRGATDGVTTPCAEARSSVTVFGSRIDIVVGYRSAP